MGGQGDGVVGFIPHPTTHTPLQPSSFRPLPLDPITLDGHLVITDTEKIKLIIRASFSCIYVTSTVTPSYETALPPPHPLNPRDPPKPLIYKKQGKYFNIWSLCYIQKINTLFHTLGGGHNTSGSRGSPRGPGPP